MGKTNQGAGAPGQPNGNANGTAHTAPAHAPMPPTNPAKRKFDDIDLGFNVGPPAPQMSYERSRPQTPAVTPSREVPQHQHQHNFLGSPPLPADHLPASRSRGASRIPSRGPTRANSPFNGYSIPATPPDLFLVTRNSPNIMWENFQPDQLFPDGTIGGSNMFGSPTLQGAVDPQLQVPNPGLADQMMGGQTSGAWPPNMQNMMSGVDGMGRNADSDRWSNSSIGNAPVAPTHLNVEDWFQFFGINGEMNPMAADPGTG